MLERDEHDVARSHREEKAECEQALGTSSCDFSERVRFVWKNTISTYKALDDPGRDVCKEQLTEPCLAQVFEHASANDVLVVGSVLSNQSCIQDLHGSTWSSVGVVGNLWT